VIRILARHQTATEGAHWHIFVTARSMQSALKTLNREWLLCASFGRELWFDHGADTAVKRLTPTISGVDQ
jgi:hypothetical protein